MSPGTDGTYHGTDGTCPRDRRDAHQGVSRQNSLCLLVFFFPCNPPGLLQESLGPSGPEVSWSVPGVSLRVSLGVFLGPFGPRAPECPKSVLRVSPECRKGVLDTLGILSGHFWTLRRPGPKGPQRHPEGHSRDTPEHFRPEGPERLL